jgi:LemA protein
VEVALAVVIGLPLVAIASYAISHNRLINDRNAVGSSWATVDAELQRRHELIPSLVESVKGLAAHEQALLVRATEAHARATGGAHTPSAADRHEPAVAAAAAELVALRERYPQLNSQQNFLDLQHRLTMTEDRIAAARRYYNTVVGKLNRRIEAFPSRFVARRMGVEPAEYFQRD